MGGDYEPIARARPEAKKELTEKGEERADEDDA